VKPPCFRAFLFPLGAPPPAPCIRQTLHPRTAGERHGFPVLFDLVASQRLAHMPSTPTIRTVPFKIIAGGPSCREELRGEDITDIVVAGERRALRRRLCPKPNELRAETRERVRRYRTQTPDERYVIREAREFHKRVRDRAELGLAERQAGLKAIKEALAKATRDGTPGILAEPTEPGSARKAIEEALAKLEFSDRADRGQAKAKRDGAPSS
jgi:hypothetical protein